MQIQWEERLIYLAFAAANIYRIKGKKRESISMNNVCIKKVIKPLYHWE
jgi:hypothetical protein